MTPAGHAHKPWRRTVCWVQAAELQPAQIVDALHAAGCWGQDSSAQHSTAASSTAGGDAASSSGGAGQGAELLTSFVSALRAQGLQQIKAMDGKTLGRFAASLASLPGGD